jgi:hypothetical protein
VAIFLRPPTIREEGGGAEEQAERNARSALAPLAALAALQPPDANGDEPGASMRDLHTRFLATLHHVQATEGERFARVWWRCLVGQEPTESVMALPIDLDDCIASDNDREVADDVAFFEWVLQTLGRGAYTL